MQIHNAHVKQTLCFGNDAHDKELANISEWKWAKKKTQNPKKFIRMAEVYMS